MNPLQSSQSCDVIGCSKTADGPFVESPRRSIVPFGPCRLAEMARTEPLNYNWLLGLDSPHAIPDVERCDKFRAKHLAECRKLYEKCCEKFCVAPFHNLAGVSTAGSGGEQRSLISAFEARDLSYC